MPRTKINGGISLPKNAATDLLKGTASSNRHRGSSRRYYVLKRAEDDDTRYNNKFDLDTSPHLFAGKVMTTGWF